MDAIVTSKMKEDQKTQIENSIIKLQKEEERANRRIKELQSRSKFVQDMNNEKNSRFSTKKEMLRDRKETEDNNRNKFNQDRAVS